ncbi:MAG: Flp pilus assembly protein CpaB [Chloroflexi bacterium]|nr:Flp pilus assembly protein CpaB [Chloroflexota bacterium]
MARSIATTASPSGRNRGVLMLAAVFGILSAALVFAFLNSGDGSGGDLSGLDSAGGAESVVVVTRDIQAGEKITADMLTTRPLPAAALLVGRVGNADDVVGKVATSPLYAGEQVTTPKVTTYVGQNSLAWKVPEGMRAISLQVPHEAWVAAGLIQPGDRVDILGITTLTTVDPLTGVERPDTITGIIAQDVEVLAISQTLVKVIPNADVKTAGAAGVAATTAKPGEDAATYEKAISITLALTPELAAKVALIDAMKDEQGQYRILPRQKGDSQKLAGGTTWSLEDIFAPKKK